MKHSSRVMKAIATRGVLLFLPTILIVCCRKKDPGPEPPVDAGHGPVTAATIVQRLSTPLLTYTIDAGVYNALVCANGI